MSLSGTLEHDSLLSVLQLLGSSSASGVLVIEEDRRAEIAVCQGWVLYATLEGAKRLGERLVEAGMIQEHELSAILAMQKRKKMRQLLGSIVCELGLAPPGLIADALGAHVAETLPLIAEMKDATFHFDPTPVSPGSVPIPDTLRIDGVILNLFTAAVTQD